MERGLAHARRAPRYVQGKPRFEITEIAGRYVKARRWAVTPGCQPPAQRLVDDLAERPAGALQSALSLAATSSSKVSVVRMR